MTQFDDGTVPEPNSYVEEVESPYAARSHKSPYSRYFNYLAMLVEKWGIHDVIGTPGAGVEIYRRLRRSAPEMTRLSTLARLTADNYNLPKSARRQLEQYTWYPMPTYINRGQGVGKDWLIERELGDVLVYVLENTNIHPMHDPKCKNMNLEARSEQVRLRTVMANFPDGATGMGRLQLEPGCAIALPLCADEWLPRRPMPDNADKPATRLVRYDPENPKHNRRLRGDFGVGMDARQYVQPEEVVQSESKKG